MNQTAVPRSIDGVPEAALAADREPSFLFWRRLDYAERRFGAAALANIAPQRLGDDDASRGVNAMNPKDMLG